ncbi:MAG: hypothetical protein H7834_00130 [Magnetococcus sp. YQC-9]
MPLILRALLVENAVMERLSKPICPIGDLLPPRHRQNLTAYVALQQSLCCTALDNHEIPILELSVLISQHGKENFLQEPGKFGSGSNKKGSLTAAINKNHQVR